jgi:hypothetical protein
MADEWKWETLCDMHTPLLESGSLNAKWRAEIDRGANQTWQAGKPATLWENHCKPPSTSPTKPAGTAAAKGG